MTNSYINSLFKGFIVFFVAFMLFCFSADTAKAATTNDPVIHVTNNDCTRKTEWDYNFGPEQYREDCYSILLQLIDYEEDLYDNGSKQWYKYRLNLQSATGNTYYFVTTDGDFSVNDYFTAIVYDNGTYEVKDDKIISIKYERPDLFLYK